MTSLGRLLVGVGVGDLEAEVQAVDVDFTTQVLRHKEYATALRALWSADPGPSWCRRARNAVEGSVVVPRSSSRFDGGADGRRSTGRQDPDGVELLPADARVCYGSSCVDRAGRLGWADSCTHRAVVCVGWKPERVKASVAAPRPKRSTLSRSSPSSRYSWPRSPASGLAGAAGSSRSGLRARRAARRQRMGSSAATL